MKKILIVEDDPQLLEIYQKKLTQEGYEVIMAKTAKEGLDVAKETMPDLAIIDILLPGENNGLYVLAMMKQDDALQNIPALVLTNLDNEEQASRTLGAIDYIVKSNTPIDDVVHKIKTILAN